MATTRQLRRSARPRSALTTLIVSLGAAASLVACSSSGSGSAPTSAAPGGSTGASASSAAAAPVSLTLGVSGVSGSDLAIYTALDAGLFKKNGVDVKLSHLTPTVGTQALASGSIPMFADGPNIVTSQLQKAPIKAIATYSVVPDYLYSKSSSKITSVADLKGKVVAISSPGGTFDTFVKEALDDAGLTAGKDVKLIYVGSSPTILAAVENGRADAGVGNYATLLEAKKRSMTEIPVPNAQDLAASHANFLGVNSKWAQSNGTTIQKFLKGVQDGVRYDSDPANKSKVIETIKKTYQLSDDDAAAFYEVSVSEGQTDLAVSADAVKATLEASTVKGAKEASATPANFIDNSYATAVGH